MNKTPHKRNPFAYHQMVGSIPDGPEISAAEAGRIASELADLQYVRHQPTQLTGLYSDTASQLRKKVWNDRNLKIVPPARPTDTVRNQQVAVLLSRFDGLFRFWGIRYPLGLAKGRHLWSDDIANSARLAYFQAFQPHCAGGAIDCRSEETTSRKMLYTPSGRVRRKVQPVTDPTGKTVCHQLKPVFRVRKQFEPSCEKAAIYALKAAKYGAMRAARKFTRHRLRETTFSSLDLKPGQSVVDYLEGLGENPVTFANEIGINSPWVDHTLQNLKVCLSPGRDRISISHDAIKTAIEKCESIDGRVNKALQIADNRGLIGPLFLRMAGLPWGEVAEVEGINLPALKTKLHRLRAEVTRIKPAS